jgi:DNA-binding LacI/PurR family transcriptional regulator
MANHGFSTMNKSDLFSEYILARIASGEYKLGTPLPSIRKLAPKFNLSYSAAQRRIAALARQGLVRSTKGRGLYIARTNLAGALYPGKRIIAFIAPYSEKDLTSTSYVALLAFQKSAALNGFHVDVNPVRFSDLAPERFIAMTEGYSGAAMFHEYDSGMSFFPGSLPTVAVLMNHSFGGRISLVNVDPAAAAEQATAYFQHQKIKRITVCSSLKPVYRERAERFCELWKHNGGSCKIDYTEPGGGKFVRGRGYFFSSDTWLYSHSLAYRKETGRELNDDFVILGIDGKHRLNPEWPPFSSIVVNWSDIGKVMFEELLRLIDHPADYRKNIMIAGNLTVDPESNFKFNPMELANDEWTRRHFGRIIES